MSTVKTYNQLLTSLSEKIQENGNKDITGPILNLFLQDLLFSLTLKHIVLDSAARNAITEKYSGMRVFVTSEDKSYELRSDLSTWDNIATNGYTQSEIDTLLTDKVDVDGAKVLSTNDFTNPYKDKIDNIEAEATKNSTDANLLNRSNHTGAQAISTITSLQSIIDGILGDIITLEDSVNVSYKNISLISTNLYQIATKDYTIVSNSTSGDKEVILPDASINNGRIIVVKKGSDDFNKTRIWPFDYNESESTSNDFQMIEGKTYYDIFNYKDSVILQARSGRWYIINKPNVFKGHEELLEFSSKNAVTTEVRRMSIPNEASGYFKAEVLTIKESDQDTYSARFFVAFKKVGDILTILTPQYKDEIGTLSTTFTIVSASDGSGDLLLKAKGISGTNIKWLVNFMFTVNKI